MATILLSAAIPLSVSADNELKHDDIRYLIMDVQSAASSGDPQQLLPHLPPIFKYSFGGDDTREGAMAFYREYPEKLSQLHTILLQGCRRQGDDFYSCPPQAAERDVIYFGPRAGFMFDNNRQRWQFNYFVEGD